MPPISWLDCVAQLGVHVQWCSAGQKYLWLHLQYIPRNMHTVFALLCFVVFIHWLIFAYPSGLLHWHCGNLTIAPVPAKQPWWKWINTSCEFIMNDCITTTKQSTTKPCVYFLGYTVCWALSWMSTCTNMNSGVVNHNMDSKHWLAIKPICIFRQFSEGILARWIFCK